jgi:hypothetical protein
MKLTVLRHRDRGRHIESRGEVKYWQNLILIAPDYCAGLMVLRDVLVKEF